jgi:phenylpropionate dioxygenase-like ring-hydroxylating dioxygenase large terminal subunit
LVIINSCDNYRLDLNMIKPRNIKKSDKYSKQIYQYIKKNPGKDRVYYISSQDIYNNESKDFELKDIPFDIDNINARYLWIGSKPVRNEYTEGDKVTGYIDWLYGNSLSTITSPSREKYTVFANPWNNKKTVIDVTEQFWEKYIEIGRCIYGNHPYGLQDDEERYTYIDDKNRRCDWCGKEEHLETKTVTYTRDEWVQINENN